MTGSYAPATYSAPVRRRLADHQPRHVAPRQRRTLWQRWSRSPDTRAATRAAWLIVWIGTLLVAFALGIWLGASIRFDVLTQAAAL